MCKTVRIVLQTSKQSRQKMCVQHTQLKNRHDHQSRRLLEFFSWQLCESSTFVNPSPQLFLKLDFIKSIAHWVLYSYLCVLSAELNIQYCLTKCNYKYKGKAPLLLWMQFTPLNKAQHLASHNVFLPDSSFCLCCLLRFVPLTLGC